MKKIKIFIIGILLFILYFGTSMLNTNDFISREYFISRYLLIYFSLILLGFIFESELNRISFKKIIANILLMGIVTIFVLFPTVLSIFLYTHLELKFIVILTISYVMNYIIEIFDVKKNNSENSI